MLYFIKNVVGMWTSNLMDGDDQLDEVIETDNEKTILLLERQGSNDLINLYPYSWTT